MQKGGIFKEWLAMYFDDIAKLLLAFLAIGNDAIEAIVQLDCLRECRRSEKRQEGWE